MKLPRKLKKKLKSIVLNSLAWPELWSTKEIKIDRFEKYMHSDRTPLLNLGSKTVTSYRLQAK